jgi:two-component system, NarL family, sensor kinase
MQPNESELIVIIVTAIILFLSLGCFIVFFFFLYQKRYFQYQRELNSVKESYQKEILKAQLEMQEQTFRNISQEIHDNIGQILSLTRLNISTINPADPLAAQRKINNSKELIDRAIDDLRDLSKRLNSDFVTKQPLSASLQFQLHLIQKTGVYQTSLEVDGEETLMEEEKKLIVFRIAQEAINNIIKHAQAQHISVLLKFLPNKIILSIRDDGKGFVIGEHTHGDASTKGIGTYNMFYRAALIGGEFSLESKPGEGTLARLVLPVPS